jgi:YD repeat-containing protein
MSGYDTDGGYCALPSVTADLTLSGGTYSLVAGGPDTSTYNSSGLLTGESDAAGDSLTITADSPTPGSGDCPDTASSCETVTSASGRALVIGSNSSGEVTSVSDPLDRTWTYGYDGSGNLTSATDPMSYETSYFVPK